VSCGLSHDQRDPETQSAGEDRSSPADALIEKSHDVSAVDPFVDAFARALERIAAAGTGVQLHKGSSNDRRYFRRYCAA